MSYVPQCFQRSPTNLTHWIIAMTVASHAVPIYSLNHRAVCAKLLFSIKEKFTVVLSPILVCILRGYIGDNCCRVAVT